MNGEAAILRRRICLRFARDCYQLKKSPRPPPPPGPSWLPISPVVKRRKETGNPKRARVIIGGDPRRRASETPFLSRRRRCFHLSCGADATPENCKRRKSGKIDRRIDRSSQSGESGRGSRATIPTSFARRRGASRRILNLTNRDKYIRRLARSRVTATIGTRALSRRKVAPSVFLRGRRDNAASFLTT